MKNCKICDEENERKAYIIRKQPENFNDERSEVCKKCMKIERNKYPVDSAERKRTHDLMRNYSINLEKYNEILKGQGGCCGICKRDHDYIFKGRSFAVDHCHDTDLIRGLLCTSCNQAIGKLGDTQKDIENAIKYLKGR